MFNSRLASFYSITEVFPHLLYVGRGQRKIERYLLAHLVLRPDTAAMHVYDKLDSCQADLPKGAVLFAVYVLS